MIQVGSFSTAYTILGGNSMVQARLITAAVLFGWIWLNVALIHDPLQSVLYVVGFFKGVL